MKDDPFQLWRHNGSSGYPFNAFSLWPKLLHGKKKCIHSTLLKGCSIAFVYCGRKGTETVDAMPKNCNLTLRRCSRKGWIGPLIKTRHRTIKVHCVALTWDHNQPFSLSFFLSFFLSFMGRLQQRFRWKSGL